MTGSFAVYDEPAKRPRFWRLEVVFAGGVRLAFSDPRRFGRIRLQRDPASEPPIALLGADPLLEPPTARDLEALLGRRRAPLKAVLLDQSVFAGVGNWVADEILYQARLSPVRQASSLTREEVARLRRSLLAVVRRAVAVRADSDRFPRTWLFHTRWGRTAGATTARGEAIVHATVGGRTTAWVPPQKRPAERRARSAEPMQSTRSRAPSRPADSGSASGSSSQSELEDEARRAAPEAEVAEVEVELVVGLGVAEVAEVAHVAADAEVVGEESHGADARGDTPSPFRSTSKNSSMSSTLRLQQAAAHAGVDAPAPRPKRAPSRKLPMSVETLFVPRKSSESPKKSGV